LRVTGSPAAGASVAATVAAASVAGTSVAGAAVGAACPQALNKTATITNSTKILVRITSSPSRSIYQLFLQKKLGNDLSSGSSFLFRFINEQKYKIT
jgi:hypothetical protein